MLHPKYRPDIDGLRAIAVLCVVAFHASPNRFGGGFIGVDIFFVISGYLISSIIFSNLELGSFSIVDFYKRRIRRIFPALIIVMTANLAFGWYVLLADEYSQLGKHVAGGAAFISNLILYEESGYFDNAAVTKPLLHLWSLAIEEQFYVFWPLMLAVIWKRKWSFLPLTAIIGVVSFAVNLYLVKQNETAAFYWPISRFWELMIGGLLAYITLHRQRLIERYNNLQSAMGFLLIAIALLLIDRGKLYPGWWALLPTIGTFFVISAGCSAYLNRVVLSNKVMVWVGLISYPLYLWHWPLLVWPRIISGEYTIPVTDRLILICLAVLLAWSTYYFVESNFKSGSYKYGTKSLPMMMVLVGTAAIFVSSGNIKPRLDNPGLEKILVASLDWDFPGRKFEPTSGPYLRYYKAHGGSHITAFIGDSNMEQYAPRINKLLEEGGASYNTSIAIGNHSWGNIISELMNKNSAVEPRVLELSGILGDKNVTNVVFAASWSDFSWSESAYKNFFNYIKSNLAGKNVYIILNIPKGPELDIHNMFEGSRLSRLTAKSASDVKFDLKKFYELMQPAYRNLRRLAVLDNVIIIDPVSYLCPDGICPVFDKDNKPLYLDYKHITASYAKNSASFIDSLLK